jgi:hypothetical protein
MKDRFRSAAKPEPVDSLAASELIAPPQEPLSANLESATAENLVDKPLKTRALRRAAGLEIDLSLFRKAQTRSVVFGVITTIVPQVLGTACGLAIGYGLIPSIVIGSLLAFGH